MRVIAYVPETEASASVVDFIDKELPEEDFTVEYATTPDDLNQLIGVSDHDAVLIFADEETRKPYAAIQNIDKRNLTGPIVTLYKDKSPKALFNALSTGSLIGVEFDVVKASKGTLSVLLNNASLGFNGQSNVKKIGALEIDFDNKQISVNGTKLHFSVRHYDLLAYLIKHSDSLCSKERIFNALYLHDDDAELKIIDVFISKIRGQLNQALPGLGDSIETVWGRGYQFTSNPDDRSKRHVRQFGILEIDLAQQEVRIRDEVIDLTINEFMLLKTFALIYPESVSREDLVIQLSKYGRDATTDTVDRVIYSVRRKLENYGAEFEKFFVPINGGNSFIMNLSRLDDKAARKIDQEIVALGPVKLNKTLSTIALSSHTFDITEHEMKIMEALADVFPGRITGKELVERVYGPEGKIFNLNNHLNKLRAKFRDANGGEDLIKSRRGVGYYLDIESERVLAKFEDKLDVTNIGPWTIDRTRHQVSYSLDGGKTSTAIPFNQSQFRVFSAIVASYPNRISTEDLLKDVYEGEIEGKEGALSSIYAQMKSFLKGTLGDYAGGFRKIHDGKQFRLNLDIDDIPQEILDGCKIKEVGPWAINETLNMFLFDGDPIDVNESEYAVVSTLIDRYPKPIKTATLAKKHFEGKQPSLNTCLTNLRKKIAETYGITEPFIQNKRGVGYVLVANKDELADEQVNSMSILQIGDIAVNLDLGQLSFEDQQIELNSAELFALKVLTKANKPVTAKLLSDFSKAAGVDREPLSMAQAVRSLEDKMEQAGFEGNLIDHRRNAGFFLSSKRKQILENSDIQDVDGLKINKTLYEITVKGISVALTPSEFKVIETLAQNPRIPLSIKDLSKLSDEDGQPFAETTLNLSKNRIRQKLIAAGLDEEDTAIITNKVRVGYFLTAMADKLDRSRINGKRATSFTDEQTVGVGALSINTITDRVEYEGTHLEGVSGKPLDVLVLMTQKHGDFVTNQELSEHFFGDSKAENIARVEMGIKSLRHMIDRTVDGLGNSIIMQVGNKGYGLTLSLEERERLLDKAGLKPKKPSFAPPPSHIKPNGKTSHAMNGAVKGQKAAQEGGGRRSMAEQLRDLKL